MLVCGDQEVRPAACKYLHVLEHLIAALGCPLARHKAQQETALGVDGGMVPVVAAEAVQRVGWVTVGLLLADEAPLLVKLDLPGLRGKKRPARCGAGRRVCQPGVSSP